MGLRWTCAAVLPAVVLGSRRARMTAMFRLFGTLLASLILVCCVLIAIWTAQERGYLPKRLLPRMRKPKRDKALELIASKKAEKKAAREEKHEEEDNNKNSRDADHHGDDDEDEQKFPEVI